MKLQDIRLFSHRVPDVLFDSCLEPNQLSYTDRIEKQLFMFNLITLDFDEAMAILDKIRSSGSREL